MAVVTHGTLTGLFRDFWLEEGVPQDLYSDASPIYTQIAKMTDRSWRGGVGQPELKFGSKAGLPGAGAPTLATAWANPTNTSNKLWIVTHNKFFQVYKIEWDTLDFDGGEGNEEALLIESAGHVKRFQNLMSCWWWGNGGGALSKMSGTGTVINGTDIITLKNKGTIIRFEVGDVLRFSDTDGTTGSVRAVSKTIIAKNENDAQLQLDSDLVTGDAVEDDDYVFTDGAFGNVFKGFFAWCPLAAPSATPFFNVDRTTNTRLGGRRKAMTAGKDPWKIVTTMLAIADRGSADMDVIATSNTVMEKLLNSARPKHLLVGTDKGGPNVYGSPVKSNPDIMRYGVDGLMCRWPARNKMVYIYSDRYLCDMEVTEAQDLTFVGTKIEDWLVAQGKSGESWQDFDGNGPRYQLEGVEQVGSAYGTRGQIVTRNTNNNMTISPSVS